MRGASGPLRGRAEETAAAGTTELLYTPVGDDLIDEAERFDEAPKPLQARAAQPLLRRRTC